MLKFRAMSSLVVRTQCVGVSWLFPYINHGQARETTPHRHINIGLTVIAVTNTVREIG